MNLLDQVDEGWQQALAARAVRISAPAEDMLRLDAVEAGPHFNKPRTNVLLRRSADLSWEFFVDDDLRYLGDDPARRQLFTGPRFQHWLAVGAGRAVRGDTQQALLCLLDWLDSPTSQSLRPLRREAKDEALPAALDVALEDVARLCSPAELAQEHFLPTVEQAAIVAEIAAAVTQRVSPCCPLVRGPSGCGKHALARAAAGALLERGLVTQVLEVSGAAVAAGMVFPTQRDERLGRVLSAARELPRTLVLLDHFDVVLEHSAIAATLVAGQLDRGLRLVGLSGGEVAPDREVPPPLQRRLRVLAVPAMDPAATAEVLRRRLASHPLAAEVELAPGLLPLLIRAANRKPGANPGAALDLLDGLLAQAAWSRAALVGPDDLWHLLSVIEEPSS